MLANLRCVEAVGSAGEISYKKTTGRVHSGTARGPDDSSGRARTPETMAHRPSPESILPPQPVSHSPHRLEARCQSYHRQPLPQPADVHSERVLAIQRRVGVARPRARDEVGA